MAGNPGSLIALPTILFWQKPYIAETNTFHKVFANLMKVAFTENLTFRVSPTMFASSYFNWRLKEVGLPEHDDTFLDSLVAATVAYWRATICLQCRRHSSTLEEGEYAQEAVNAMFKHHDFVKVLRNHETVLRAIVPGTDKRPTDDTTRNRRFISQCNLHVSMERNTREGYPLVVYTGPSSGTRSGARRAL